MTSTKSLQPPDVKRTFSLETKDLNHDNEQAKLVNKREIYRQRNQQYVKAMYGDIAAKEEVRKNNRISLQQQIQEHDNNFQRHLKERYKESDFAINYDKACLQQDAVDKYERLKYLKTFRDENKKIMERKAEQLKHERQAAYVQERKLLSQSPINWSKTLH
ncbi:uncharacterized protein LOC110236122 [Exaiptasia diaphana]|uniref:Uncharacterized protein n=1 Tax=Exaiptasia diaphana TaxID=2652724 RepID=A0A913X132_EXADI|nr:uncharacterized protein LOC110236122 [Exaiptasia diaphana]KXJ16252.1 hypothetical protein AC249_AIPGENE1394 [Exaiptasia diaphana]